MKKKKVVFIAIVSFLIAFSFILLLVIKLNRPSIRTLEPLTSSQRVEFSNLEQNLSGGFLNDLDLAREATTELKSFVEKNPNMEYDGKTGADVLLNLAKEWQDLSESQNLAPEKQEVLDTYLLYLQMYPNHQEADEAKRYLRTNGVEPPD